MRQLLSLRMLGALGALALLALAARSIFSGDATIPTVVDTTIVERRIDLIEPIESALLIDGFRVEPSGRTAGFLDLSFDAHRSVRIAPGTPGEVACPQLGEEPVCAFFGDMLGDAVVWFSIRTRTDATTVELPPIVELDEGDAVLTNGWRLAYPPVIRRDCPGEDIPTFSDFLRRFGPDSTTIVDLTTHQVVAVRC